MCFFLFVCLFVYFFVFLFCFLSLVFHFGAKDCKRMIFFQRVQMCIWAIGGQELGTLSIRVHNSLAVHDNSWVLKFDSFSEFQNVISDSPLPQSPASLWCFVYENLYVTHRMLDALWSLSQFDVSQYSATTSSSSMLSPSKSFKIFLNRLHNPYRKDSLRFWPSL